MGPEAIVPAPFLSKLRPYLVVKTSLHATWTGAFWGGGNCRPCKTATRQFVNSGLI